jgi:hypothetical protein
MFYELYLHAWVRLLIWKCNQETWGQGHRFLSKWASDDCHAHIFIYIAYCYIWHCQEFTSCQWYGYRIMHHAYNPNLLTYNYITLLLTCYSSILQP